MNKELITSLYEHMQEVAKTVNLKVKLQDQENKKFIQIQLLDSNNNIIYSAYEVNEIVSFIHGLRSNHRP